MKLKRTSYVAPEPPPGGLRTKVTDFRLKVHFSRRKSAAWFICAKTFSGRVIYKAFAELSSCVPKWFVGDAPLYVKCVVKKTYPVQKRRLPIDIRS